RGGTPDRDRADRLVADVAVGVREDQAPGRDPPALERRPQLVGRARAVHREERGQPAAGGGPEPAQRDGTGVAGGGGGQRRPATGGSSSSTIGRLREARTTLRTAAAPFTRISSTRSRAGSQLSSKRKQPGWAGSVRSW